MTYRAEINIRNGNVRVDTTRVLSKIHGIINSHRRHGMGISLPVEIIASTARQDLGLDAHGDSGKRSSSRPVVSSVYGKRKKTLAQINSPQTSDVSLNENIIADVIRVRIKRMLMDGPRNSYVPFFERQPPTPRRRMYFATLAQPVLFTDNGDHRGFDGPKGVTFVYIHICIRVKFDFVKTALKQSSGRPMTNA